MRLNRVFDPQTGLDPKITPTTIVYTILDAYDIDRVFQSWEECPLDVEIYQNSVTFKESQLNKEYFIRYYSKPTELLSESTELSIPDDDVDTLYMGVNSKIEYEQYGNPSNWMVWKTDLVPKFQMKMNKNFKWERLGGKNANDTSKRGTFKSAYC
ncbi:MAG: hypothetical protein GY941_22135 [Planctomycetes bacterium]|nr:hypothetical protein [Planctomycetota bacterium]